MGGLARIRDVGGSAADLRSWPGEGKRPEAIGGHQLVGMGALGGFLEEPEPGVEVGAAAVGTSILCTTATAFRLKEASGGGWALGSLGAGEATSHASF